METRAIATSGGFSGVCREYQIDPAIALDSVWAAIDDRKGALFVGNYEVPDRYARWDTGFV